MPPSARTPWSWNGPSTSTSRACARSWARRPTSSRPFAALDIDSMSHGSRSLDILAGRHRLAELPPGVEQVGDELRPDDPDVGGSLDAQADLPALNPDDRDADVVADHQF